MVQCLREHCFFTVIIRHHLFAVTRKRHLRTVIRTRKTVSSEARFLRRRFYFCSFKRIVDSTRLLQEKEACFRQEQARPGRPRTTAACVPPEKSEWRKDDSWLTLFNDFPHFNASSHAKRPVRQHETHFGAKPLLLHPVRSRTATTASAPDTRR